MTQRPSFDEVLRHIADRSGEVTSAELSALFPVDNVTYGRQRYTSQLVSKLRKAGFIEDVAKRCDHCGAALTRSHRNVPLRITTLGLEYLSRAAR